MASGTSTARATRGRRPTGCDRPQPAQRRDDANDDRSKGQDTEARPGRRPSAPPRPPGRSPANSTCSPCDAATSPTLRVVTATEVWLLAAAIVAGIGAVVHLLAHPRVPSGLGAALVAAAITLLAVALIISPLT